MALRALFTAALVLLVAAAFPANAARAIPKFDVAEAKFYASLCGIAYCDLPDIQAWKCAACDKEFTPRLVYAAPGTKQTAYVLDNKKDTTIVVFKGTEPLSW